MKQINLSGSWQIMKFDHNPDGITNFKALDNSKDFVPAQVPGDVHNDLKIAGKIPDPYWSDNASQCGWVTECDWAYIKDFELSEKDIDSHMFVEFDGIDTFADVYLNGEKLGVAANMFLKYTYDIKELVKSGKNRFVVYVKSIKNMMKDFPEEGYFGCFNVQRIFIRKAQCHFSWDWAPNFPATGIWGDVRIVAYTNTRFDTIEVRTKVDGNIAVLYRFRGDCFDTSMHIKREVEFTLHDDNNPIYIRRPIMGEKNHLNFRLNDPVLWWPCDMGDPHLYSYTISFYEDGVLTETKDGKFGVREVEFDETPRMDEGGFKCNFKINGKLTFLKGANWVPLDIMSGVVTDEKYTKAITMAKKANFNCLRIWGGGIYEKDKFYDLCNELGIMVWQDFAFACSDVPDDHPGFNEQIIPEIEYQVKRLRNHPSIIVWSGGNEKTGSFGKMKSRGDNLIYYIVRGVAGHLDHTRVYFPSSPWGYADDGNSQESGDSHCNSYQTSMVRGKQDKYREVLSEFTPPMSSEIAVQGCAPIYSLKKYIPEDKLWPINDIWDLHFTRNPYDGTGTTFAQQQVAAVDRLYGQHTGLLDFVKKSMAVHAEFVKGDAEFHRSRKGNCGGAMFWMYSDVWPCGTWAQLDYYMIPKAAYYASAHAFRPLLPLVTRRKDGVKAFVVNDTTSDAFGKITIQVKKFDGTVLFEKVMDSVNAKACESTPLFTFADEHTADTNTYIAISFDYSGKTVKNLYHDALWGSATLIDPSLTYNVEKSEKTADGYLTKVKVSVKGYAKMVNIRIDPMESFDFSDNYFDMEAGETSTVEIISKEAINSKDVSVFSFTDTWC